MVVVIADAIHRHLRTFLAVTKFSRHGLIFTKASGVAIINRVSSLKLIPAAMGVAAGLESLDRSYGNELRQQC